MRYWPQHKTCEELVIAAGFTHTGPSGGWEKHRKAIEQEGWISAYGAKRTDRLHAFIHEGNINVHLDKFTHDPKKHQSVYIHYLVEKQMKQFRKIDWPIPKKSIVSKILSLFVFVHR